MCSVAIPATLKGYSCVFSCGTCYFKGTLLACSVAVPADPEHHIRRAQLNHHLSHAHQHHRTVHEKVKAQDVEVEAEELESSLKKLMGKYGKSSVDQYFKNV